MVAEIRTNLTQLQLTIIKAAASSAPTRNIKDRITQLQTKIEKTITAIKATSISSIRIGKLENEFNKAQKYITEIKSRFSDLFEVRKILAKVTRMTPHLSADMNEVLDTMVNNKTSELQIYKASIQLMLLQRIDNYAHRIVSMDQVDFSGEKRFYKILPKRGIASPADRFGRDSVIFSHALNGMLQGDKNYHIKKVKSKEAREIIQRIKTKFQPTRNTLSPVLEKIESLKKLTTNISKFMIHARKIESLLGS